MHRKYTMPDMTRGKQAPRVENKNQDNHLHSRNPNPNLQIATCVSGVEIHLPRDPTKCVKPKAPNVTPARESGIAVSFTSNQGR